MTSESIDPGIPVAVIPGRRPRLRRRFRSQFRQDAQRLRTGQRPQGLDRPPDGDLDRLLALGHGRQAASGQCLSEGVDQPVGDWSLGASRPDRPIRFVIAEE